MAVTFPRVPLVSPGDKITSSQLSKLADAINARLKVGLGDPCRRIIWYWFSQFRQIRNPDESGYLYPSSAEFFETYQHIHPSEFTWPITGPGEPEGTNVASLMGAFVFGSEADDAYPEDMRIADPASGGIPLVPVTTNLQMWALAKLQRGQWDPDTGAMASPSFTAARSMFSIVRSTFGPHGNSYGGFFPTPEQDGDCGDSTPDFPATPSYIIKFKSLVDGVADKTYPGTCVGSPGHVVYIAQTPLEYIVVSNDGGGDPTVIEYLPVNEWVEGPYDRAGLLRRRSSNFMARAINYFAAQFRGSDAQRASATGWNENTFDFQKFLTSQYVLAPARGTDLGGGNVEAVYPALWLFGELEFPSGEDLEARSGGGTTIDVNSGHVVVSAIFSASKLVGSVTVNLYADGALIEQIALTADDDGNADQIVVFDSPPTAGVTLRAEIATKIKFSTVSSSAGLIVEFAEVMEYKPLAHDIYAVLRAGGCRVELANGTDGVGFDETAAREIGDGLTTYGVLLNQHNSEGPAGSEAEINTNAIFESARRMSKCIRILKRHHLIGYEVKDGSSILYFKRFTEESGGGITFDPAAPPAEYEVATGNLVAGESYLVVGTAPGLDYITHDSVDYDPGSTFKALNANYTATGDAKVYIVRKHVIGSGTTGSFDAFDGIAPSRWPIGPADLETGRTYVVRGTPGNVVYNGQSYTDGQTFTAVSGSNVFTEHQSAKVYQQNGIRHSAPPNGFSNEWLVGFDFKVYREEETSPWKPDAYSDWHPFSDRCQFYQDWLTHTLNADARRHFAYGSKIWMLPEGVPGYRYSFDLNKKDCDETDSPCKRARRRFYNSCRLYEPFLEVDTTEILFEGGQEIVKVTVGGELVIESPWSKGFSNGFYRRRVKGRLHHHHGAPTEIPRDIASWDLTALRNEDYRTDENAIREYLVQQYYGTNCTAGEAEGEVQTGNSAIHSIVWDTPQPPFGACYPSIYLVQQIPAPHYDDNDDQDATDSPFMHDQLLTSELYIRAMCEGFVDGSTSELYGCTTGIYSLYDYTFENLCLDGFGGRWFTTLATEETDYLDASMVRTDKPQGFGPLPNVMASSEVYNQFARCLNKLTKVRIDVPFTFEVKTMTGTSDSVVSNVTDSAGAHLDCPGNVGPPGAIWSGSPPDAGASTVSADWHVSGGLAQSSVSSVFPASLTPPNRFECSGNDWIIRTYRSDELYRIKPTDPDMVNAFQRSWANMVDTNPGVLAITGESVNPLSVALGPTVDGTPCGASAYAGWPVDGAIAMIFSADATLYVTGQCSVVSSGVVRSQASPRSQVRGCYRAETDNQSYSGGPGTTKNLEVVEGSTPFIEVPLV